MYICYVYTYRGLAKKNPTVFNLFLRIKMEIISEHARVFSRMNFSFMPTELEFHAEQIL